MHSYRMPLVLGVLVILVMVGGIWFISQQNTRVSGGIFKLNEFGIQIDVPASLNDLAYEAIPQERGPVLHMKSRDITDMARQPCELGIFYEIQKDDVGKTDFRWSQSALEAGKSSGNEALAQVKEFTDFYLIFEPSQAACARTDRAVQTESEKRSALWNALSTARFAS